MSVRLAVYPSHQITAQDYALQAERSLSSGIFYGGVVTISDSTTLHITSGVGIAHGRIFDITSEDITVELSTGSTLHGRLYVHVDLADADTPISLLTEVAASLSTLTQDEDMNESSGVWEMELATFDVSTTEISNLSYTAPGVSALGSDNIATVEAGTTATQAYVADEYVVVGGQLYIVTSAIAIGDTFTVGTNITATTVGTELSELNSRLNVKYDEDDDYLYVEINGAWVKTAIKAYAQSLAVFANGNFGIEVQNGIYSYSDSYTARPFTLENNVIIEDGIPVSYCDSIVSQNIIDFSVYGKINVKNSFQDIECDVSGYNGTGYLCVSFRRYSDGMYLHVGVSSQKQYFGNNIINNLAVYVEPSGNTITITEITIE